MRKKDFLNALALRKSKAFTPNKSRNKNGRIDQRVLVHPKGWSKLKMGPENMGDLLLWPSGILAGKTVMELGNEVVGF